jgi:hypothetical protein
MSRKQWAAFEKVTAADVNTNLADQSVMVFASTAARAAALPSPSVGMQSAVTASPDLGAPRYWDGSAWTLVQNGSPYANVWTLGDQTQQASVSQQNVTTTSNVWLQISASLGTDAIIHGFEFFGSTTAQTIDIGTGGSGSEVVRWTTFTAGGGVTAVDYHAIPYGIGVANGTRIAFRTTSGAANQYVIVHYTPTSSVPSLVQMGWTSSATFSGTSWVEIASTPPLAGGCWIVGLEGRARFFTTLYGMQLGFGGSGSEVAATQYMQSISDYLGGRYVVSFRSPVLWNASTRLAVRSDNASAGQTARVIWRETLT